MALTKVIGEGLGNLDENITFSTAGKGVHLGVTSATASNLVHDYEEGSFTPTWVGAGGGTPTYNTQNGRYTKIGNRVHVTVYLYITNLGSLSGNLHVAGFPFTASNISAFYHATSFWCNSTANGNNMDGDYFLSAFLDVNSTKVFIYSLDGDGGVAQINHDKITNSTDIMLNFTYQTDA